MDNTTVTLPLIDVNSPHCALRVEKALLTVPTITSAEVDLDAHVAHIKSSEPAQAVKEAVAAIRQAGYQVATDQRSFDTTGITCGGCAKSVTTILSALPGVLAVGVDVPNHTATVEVVKGTVSDDTLADALMPTGYRLLPQAV
jgi:copper chaperone CopZ